MAKYPIDQLLLGSPFDIISTSIRQLEERYGWLSLQSFENSCNQFEQKVKMLLLNVQSTGKAQCLPLFGGSAILMRLVYIFGLFDSH
ncbi:MAG: hypothetical protein EZS28_011746 [Streblomastix strix]|uniref:Uncharacterized protein n=1 Tax=Streblomastix strix TaxID=222440 RepID=A0A5J4WCP4_9EUKA|nr:MAG: hypothetical protein EZS28_011746 [Streblomastix strix]